MNAKSILSSNSFWIVNKGLVKTLGDIRPAVLLSYLVDKEDYHRQRNELIESENELWFFAVSEKIEDVTTLGYKPQKHCIKILIDHDLVMVKLIGVPAKLHFTIRHNKICLMVTSSITQTAKLDSPFGSVLQEHNYKEQNTNKTIKENKLNPSEGYIQQEEKEKSCGKKEKLPIEELRIIDSIKKVTAYFKKWPDMKTMLLEGARIIESKEPNFIFEEQLEAWVRHNSSNLNFCFDPSKHVSRSFQPWLKRFHQFKPKEKTTHGKNTKTNPDPQRTYKYGTNEGWDG
jgi:hypothetical protein